MTLSVQVSGTLSDRIHVPPGGLTQPRFLLFALKHFPGQAGTNTRVPTVVYKSAKLLEERERLLKYQNALSETLSLVVLL